MALFSAATRLQSSVSIISLGLILGLFSACRSRNYNQERAKSSSENISKEFEICEKERRGSSYCKGVAGFRDEMRAKFIEYFRDYKDVQDERALQLSRLFSARKTVDILNSVLMNDNALEEASRNSYKHGLGFLKLVVMADESEKGWDLRLHVWTHEDNEQDKELSLEGTHQHRWNLASYIITGQIHNIRYDIEGFKERDSSEFKDYVASIGSLSETERSELFNAYEIRDFGKFNPVPELLQRLKRQLESKTRTNPRGWNEKFADVYQEFRRSAARLEGSTKKTEDFVFSRYTTVKPYSADKHTAGTLYLHPMDQPHRVLFAPDIYTATFALAGKEKADIPSVLRRVGYVTEGATVSPQRVNYTKDEVSAKIADALRALKSNQDFLDTLGD